MHLTISLQVQMYNREIRWHSQNLEFRSEEPFCDAVPVPLHEQRPGLSAEHTHVPFTYRKKRATQRKRNSETYSGSPPPPPLEPGGDARQERGRSLQGRAPPTRKRPPAAGVESMLRSSSATRGLVLRVDGSDGTDTWMDMLRYSPLVPRLASTNRARFFSKLIFFIYPFP